MFGPKALTAVVLFIAAASVSASPYDSHHARHSHRSEGNILPGRWFQERDHPVHDLFRRTHVDLKKRQSASPTSATPSSTPSVGSAAWSALYPQSTPDVNALPKAWTDALNAAVQAGKIPSVPVSTESGGNSPTYPQGVNRNDPSVCAATDRVCRIPEDIWDAPDGMIGIGFDDGPTPASPTLYAYLKQQQQKATHFMIGVNILNNWQSFLSAYNDLDDDIAVHTYTHPYMTSLTNEQVVAQLGWTMQIIHDSTNGKLPRFWRPPYGDIDTRVSAIGREVFGLTAIIWNQDTEDWSVASGGTTLPAIATNMQKWLTGSKTPGLIILEHELDNNTVGAFMQNYPLVKQNGWNAVSTAQLNSTLTPWQGGGAGNDGTPGSGTVVGDLAFASSAPSTSTSTTSSTSSGSGSSGSGTSTGSSATKTGGAASQATTSASGAEQLISYPLTSVLSLALAGFVALL